MATDFKDWRVSQKYIRIAHNKIAKDFFKQTEIKQKININLKNSVLIYKNDTATQCLIKMKFFEQYVTEYAALKPVIPEWWQVRKGANVPQLVVVFKPKYPTQEKKNMASRWSLSLPHFIDNPQKIKHLTGYNKGNVQGMVTFKDNSKLIIYGKHKTEVKQTIHKWVKASLFDPTYLDKSNYELKIGEINTNANFQILEVIPTYAKYFKTGQKDTQPDWAAFI